MPLIEEKRLVRVLVCVALLASAGAILIACSAPQYEGGGRRTDLGDGGFSVSGSVSSDAGLPGTGADSGRDDAGCVAGDGGALPLDCLL